MKTAIIILAALTLVATAVSANNSAVQQQAQQQVQQTAPVQQQAASPAISNIESTSEQQAVPAYILRQIAAQNNQHTATQQDSQVTTSQNAE